ncbi:MAG: rRNA maturation RNase YbeY [Xenococcus sp. (in: cyanobacteria)]
MKVEVYIENTYAQDPDNSLEQSLITSLEKISWQNWFQIWLEAMASEIPLADSYELSLRLNSDREMQELNSQYRQQNKPTDVLAFAALETEVIQPENTGEPLYLGDIVISLDTAAQQARDRGHSLVTEVAWLASHGFLHLLGWDHPDETNLRKMLSQQVTLLKLVVITDLS